MKEQRRRWLKEGNGNTMELDERDKVRQRQRVKERSCNRKEAQPWTDERRKLDNPVKVT